MGCPVITVSSKRPNRAVVSIPSSSVQNLLPFTLLSKNRKIERQNYNFACSSYGCETKSLTLKEGQGLRVFENKVLRRIFGLKKDKVVGGWRELYDEELHNL
jgi:hypothetical protein